MKHIGVFIHRHIRRPHFNRPSWVSILCRVACHLPQMCGVEISVSHLSRIFSAEWPATLSPRTSDVCTCFYRTRFWTRTTPPRRSDKPEPKDGSARLGLGPTTQICPVILPGFMSEDTHRSSLINSCPISFVFTL